MLHVYGVLLSMVLLGLVKPVSAACGVYWKKSQLHEELEKGIRRYTLPEQREYLLHEIHKKEQWFQNVHDLNVICFPEDYPETCKPLKNKSKSVPASPERGMEKSVAMKKTKSAPTPQRR